MSADADGDVAALERAIDDHELFGHLGLSLRETAPGYAAFTVPFHDGVANLTAGVVHGGVTATAIDTASGFALRSTFEDPAAVEMTTTDLNVKYLRPATDDLLVEAEVVRAGDSIGVTDAEVSVDHEGERRLVATGGTTFRLFRGEGSDDG